MDRRTFMKLMGGLASMPIVGRLAKPLKSETVQEGIASLSGKGMELYEMVVAKVMKEGKKIGESGRVDSYKHPDRPDITVDVNQTDGSAEIYFDTDKGSKGYAKIDRDMETGGDELIEAEEIYKGTPEGDYYKDVEEGISGGLENLDEFTRIKKNIGGSVQPYDPRASATDFAKAIDMVGAGTDMQKARAIQDYGQNVQRQNPLGQSLKNFGNTLTEGLQAALNYGSIPANFAAGITGLPIGYTTQQMRDTMDAAARASTRKGPEGGMYVGYGDLGAIEGPDGQFLGMNPDMTSAQRALALTSGDVEFKINPATGKINYDPDTLAYDFNQANPLSTGNKESGAVLNFINQGGLMGQRVYTPMDSTFDPTMTQLESVNNIEKIARDSQYGLSTPTYDSASAGAIITDGPNKFRINADGSRTLIGKETDENINEKTRPTMADVAGPTTQDDYYAQNESAIRSGMMPAQRPTMADVAGPAKTFTPDSEGYAGYEGIVPGFTARKRSDGRFEYKAPDGQVYGPDTYSSIAAGRYPNIYDPNKQSLKDGGSVDLTIITMPDISGSGVESLFKTR